MTSSGARHGLGGLIVTLLAASLFAGAPALADLPNKSLGKQAADQLEEEIGVVRDPVLSAWVERVGNTIVRADGGNPRDYSFTILNTGDVNAFALPGGFVYVTMGLLRFVDSEDELAGVVGHEIGHITARHGVKQVERNTLLSLALALLRGHVPGLVATLADVGGVLYSLKHTRSDEAAADALGARKAAAAGYDPMAMVEFLRKMGQKEKQRPSHFEVYFMTHPPTAERIKKAEAFPETDPNNLAVRRAAAEGLARRGLYAEAGALYDTLIAHSPDEVSLDLAAADCWERAGVHARAERDRERARKLGDPAAAPPPPGPDRTVPAPPPAERDAVAAASAAVVRAHDSLVAGHADRVKRSGDIRRGLDDSRRRFRDVLDTLNTVASDVAPADLLRQEMLHRVGIAVANQDYSLSQVDEIAQAAGFVPDDLARAAEEINGRLAKPDADTPLLAIADQYALDAGRAAKDVDTSLDECRGVLRQVDAATQTCLAAAQALLNARALPEPFLIGRLSQADSLIHAATTGAASAAERADRAGLLAEAADARRRALALDLLGQETPLARRPAVYSLLWRRFGVPESQALALARESAPLGQSAAGLVLGMAARLPEKPDRRKPHRDDSPAAGEETARPGPAAGGEPVKPVTIDAAVGRKRRASLAALNISLRLLGLEVTRENGAAARN